MTEIDWVAARERAAEDNAPEPFIDWKRRYEQAVSDAIEGKAKVSAKLRERDQQLNTAKLRITELEARVRELTPAAEKLRALEITHDEAMAAAAKKVEEFRVRVLRGQRGVLVDVITELQDRVRRLPAPDPEETWGE